MSELCCKPRHQQEGRFAVEAFDMHSAFMSSREAARQGKVRHYPVCLECSARYFPDKALGFTERELSEAIQADLVAT